MEPTNTRGEAAEATGGRGGGKEAAKEQQGERLEAAKKLKATWRKRREEEILPEIIEDEPDKEEVEKNRELEEEVMLEEFIREAENWCLECAGVPCVCILTYLELKIKTLKGKEEQKPTETWRKRRRSSDNTETEDEIIAGHQHHPLEADAQQDGWGQLQHQHVQGVGVASRLGGEAKRIKTITTRNMKITLPEVSGEAADGEVEEASPPHLPPTIHSLHLSPAQSLAMMRLPHLPKSKSHPPAHSSSPQSQKIMHLTHPRA